MPSERQSGATAVKTASAAGAALRPPAGGDDGDSRVGDFHLLRRLGKGGMAEVWLAEQTSLKRHVALKLLKRDLTDDPTYIKRFEAEAKAAADNGKYATFFHHMLDQGIALAPGAYEVLFPSLAHTDADIDRTIEAAAKAARAL